MKHWADIASFALCFAGLGGICLTMSRHHKQAFGHASSRARALSLRVGGWLLLALSLISCIRAWGVDVGLVYWFGCITAAAAVIVILLPYSPKAVARFSAIAAPAGVLLLFL